MINRKITPASPKVSKRLQLRRALLDPVQDRRDPLKVRAPVHPLIPPRHPEVSQRAGDVTAGGPVGALAADDDVERLVPQAVLPPGAAQERHKPPHPPPPPPPARTPPPP